MDGMEAAARPARDCRQESRTGNRTASPMQVTSAVKRNGSEPQPDNGPLLRAWICPQEDRTPSPMAPKPPRAWALQLQGPSVLESKVRALKDKMAVGKLGAKPCPTPQECSSSRKPKCLQIKPGVVQGCSLPDALVVHYSHNLTHGQLDSSANEKETAKNGDSRLPRPPVPGLECWNGQNPWSPEAMWMLHDNEMDLPLGFGCLQDSPIHQVSVDQPQGPPGPCKIHMPSLKKEKPYPFQDGLGTERDLDSTALTTKENLVPRTDLWRAGNLGILGTESNALSLSDRVEKNRLLLQKMLKVSEQSSLKEGSPAGTPSWDRAILERPAGDMDWDLGIHPDSGQSRTFAPNLEPVQSTRHEEAKHLLRRSRMKARTQPLRASHDIVPTIAQGSRDGERSPALNVRTTSACRDSFQNRSLSDSCSGESSSGQWPKQGMPLSHVRFEDESAGEVEFRYMERQRQVLSMVLHTVGQGPLCSKPDLTNYINHDLGDSTFHRPSSGLDCSSFLVPPPVWDCERKCHACGSRLEENCPAERKAAPDLRVLQGLQATCGTKVVLPKPHDSQGLDIPFLPLPVEPGLHTEGIRETHIRGTITALPEEGDSVLDSTHTSNNCWTDSEEARTTQPSRAGQQSSRPQGGHSWFQKASRGLPQGLQASPHLPGLDGVVVEVKGAKGHMPQRTWYLRDDSIPKPSALESEKPSMGSRRQPGLGLGSHCAHPEYCGAPCRTVYITSSMKLQASGSSQAQVMENHESLETLYPSSLQQNSVEPSAPHPALQPASPLSPEGWMPTPPSSRKSPCPKPPRKSAWTGHHRQEHQTEPMDVPLPLSSPKTMVLTPSQTQLCRPQVRHPLLDLSTNCNDSIPPGLQEPWGLAIQKDRVEKNPCCLESAGDGLLRPGDLSGQPGSALLGERGAVQDSLGSSDVATVNSTAITLSLTTEEPESSQELERGLQRVESSSGDHMPTGASPGASAGPRPPSAAPSDGNKKRSKSIASTLGLKKLFSALGHTSRPKLSKSCSYSVEQLQPGAPASHSSTPKVKRAPSLQTLHLVSPSCQHRKAASFQNLHSLLSGKGDRSSLYLVEVSGDPTPGRPAKALPQRALSVEDVSAPSLARTVGRVVEVFSDGTSQMQLQRPPEGTFGFCVAYGNGQRDSGLYVQAMADLDTAKLYSGLLGVGDEILEVNGAKVAGLGLAHIKQLLAHAETLSVRVLRQRPVPQ